jgi:hypothetical protein
MTSIFDGLIAKAKRWHLATVLLFGAYRSKQSR